MEFLSSSQKPATVAEISRALSIPQSSASGLLHSLKTTSFIHYNPDDRTFSPSIRIWFLGNRLSSAKKTSLQSALEGLKILSQETVSLAIRNEIFSQYVYVGKQGTSLDKFIENGSVRPLISSASGWNLLKDETDFDIGKVIRRSLNELNIDKERLNYAYVMDQIEFSRKHGYSFSRGGLAKGVSGISVILPDFENSPKMAITIAGSSERILHKKDELVEVLSRTTRKLAKE